jgi:antitoxin ParD1/3/4
MTTISISLPESLKQFVDEQISAGAYRSTNEYVLRLISDDQERKYREEIEQKLLEALNSGDYSPMTGQDWEELRTLAKTKPEGLGQV